LGSKKATEYPFLMSCSIRYSARRVLPTPVVPKTKVWRERSRSVIEMSRIRVLSFRLNPMPRSVDGPPILALCPELPKIPM